MSTTLKVVIAVGSALLVGFIVGYATGASGKGDLEDLLSTATRRSKTAESTLKDERKEAQTKLVRERRKRLALRARVQMLRALVELYSNNYGLASQHLGSAILRLQKMRKHLSDARKKKLRELVKRITQAQQLVVRLDPMARRYVTEIATDLRRHWRK